MSADNNKQPIQSDENQLCAELFSLYEHARRDERDQKRAVRQIDDLRMSKKLERRISQMAPGTRSP